MRKTESQQLFDLWTPRIGSFVRLLAGTEANNRASASNVTPGTIGVLYYTDHNPSANCIGFVSFRRADHLEFADWVNVNDLEHLPGPVDAFQLPLVRGDIVTVESAPRIENFTRHKQPVQFRVISFGRAGEQRSSGSLLTVSLRYNHKLAIANQSVCLEFVGNLLPVDGETIDAFMNELKIVSYNPRTTRCMAPPLARARVFFEPNDGGER